MKLQFFTISAIDPVASTESLNTFCAQHRMVDIEKQFVNNGSKSFWSICVTYADNEGSFVGSIKKRKTSVDYKEVLNDDDFTIYSQLRDMRKSVAEKEGTAVYNVFTNEQLAMIVTKKITTKASLQALEGVGKTRVDKYADIFILKYKELTGLA